MGISLSPGAADSAVQAMSAKAKSGDKQAQYELGRWFEDSTDPDGLKKAIKLYRIAATPRGGSRLLHVPGPNGVTTSIVSLGPKIEPNKAAQDRLDRIQIELKGRIRSGRLNPVDRDIIPAHDNLPVSERLVIGRRRIVYGTLKSIDFMVDEEKIVCNFLTPLYEKYYNSPVTECNSSALILDGRDVIYSVDLSNEIQKYQLYPDGEEFSWIWLEGTTKSSLYGKHCGKFSINSVGTGDKFYDILVGPVNDGVLDLYFMENGRDCNVRNLD